MERMVEFMLALRRNNALAWGILALLVIAFMPLPAYASDYGTEDLTLGSRGSAVSQLQKTWPN